MDLLTFIILSVLFSAFFSGSEIAFLSSNKLKIELDSTQGSFPAKILSQFVQRPSRFIGTLLVGNNIALVVYGILMEEMLAPKLFEFGLAEASQALLVTVISTIIILFAGEYIPKTLFRINSNFLLRLFAIPLRLIYIILWPLTIIMVGFSELIVKLLFKVNMEQQQLVFGRIDLDNYVKEITAHAEKTEEELDHEITIFQNALDFSKVKVRECMVPRTDITALSLDDDVEKLREVFIDTGYSKILIYRENIDNIIGYVNSVDLFQSPTSIKHLIVPVIIIPETISAREVLELFTKQNKSIAVVVDEFGGTSGMVTIEDIIEEIFGEIEDEHDKEELLEEQIDENNYHFSGRLEVDYINDQYKLNLPESEEYDTLAGLIIHICEDIPKLNQKFEFDRYQFKITDVTNVRIESVLIHVIPED